MSSPVVTVSPATSARAALELMTARNVRRLPAVEGERLVGIVTKSDVEAAIGRDHRRGRDKSVADIMTRDVVSVAPDETLEGAAQNMLQRRISGLPVLEAEGVVGIITESDLFRALCAMLGIGEPSARIVMSVPDSDDLLQALAVKTQGLELRSMATYRNLFQNRWEVALRVRSTER